MALIDDLISEGADPSTVVIHRPSDDMVSAQWADRASERYARFTRRKRYQRQGVNSHGRPVY